MALAAHVLKIAVALAAIVLVVLEGRRRLSGRVAERGWIVLAVLAFAAHYRLSPVDLVRRIDAYDLVHYYLNAKYFPELGYTRLYRACLVADGEGKNQMRHLRSMRNLDDQVVGHRGYIREVRRRPDAVKRHFTPERWAEFSADLAFLQRYEDVGRVVLDRGYNASPSWHVVGHALASIVPARHVALLCRLDLVLVGLMLFVVGRTYGRRVALVALVWLGIGFSSLWPGIGWAMLRFDWLVATVLGVCAIARGRRVLGGALVGWAALSRLFPAVILVFLAARAAHRLVARRELDRAAVAIAAGWIAVVGLGSAVTWKLLGTEHYRDFAHDLEIQVENLSHNRMGIGVALAYRGEVDKSELPPRLRRERFAEARRLAPVGQAIGLIILAVCALSVSSRAGPRPARDDDDLAQLGALGFVCLATASYYYWNIRILAVLLHARHAEQSLWDRRGLVALFAIEVWSLTWNGLAFQYAAIATTSIVVTLWAASVSALRALAALRPASSP